MIEILNSQFLEKIDTAFTRARKTFYGATVQNPFNQSNILLLPFYNNLLSIPKLVKVLGINIVFKNTCTLKSLLIKNSPNQGAGCIYQVPCSQCNKVYLGQSGKELTVRLKQHKYNVRTGNMSSALFVHMNEFNHRIEWQDAKELIYCKDLVKRNIIESSIIKVKADSLLNLSQGLYKLDEILCKRIMCQMCIK